MKGSAIGRALWLALALVLAAAQGAASQSLFNAVGMGTPMDPLDARGVALGGMGIGLMGGDLVPTDPAAASGLLLPTLVMTARPSWVNFTRSAPAESGSFESTLFPLLGLGYPIPHIGVVTVMFSSVLDQRYRARQMDTVNLFDTTTTSTDIYQSRGGVASVRVGLARTFGQRVSVGLAVGRYTGTTTKQRTRIFNDTLIAPYQIGGSWTYYGELLAGGASVQLGGIARVAGSFTWSSTLHAAAASDTTQGGDAYYDLPFEYRVGASALLARGLTLTAGVARANWAAVKPGPFTDGSSGTTTTSFGVGLELSRASMFGRTSPIRLGYRRSELPFTPSGQSKPVETDLSGGIGIEFHKQGDYTLAGLGLTVERGTRHDNSLTEHFWRGSLTLSVTGF